MIPPRIAVAAEVRCLEGVDAWDGRFATHLAIDRMKGCDGEQEGDANRH